MDIGSLTGVVSIEDQLSEALTLCIEKVKSFVEEFDEVIGTMALGAGLAAAAIIGTAVAIEELGKEGSKIIGVENAFDHLAESAGTTGEELRGALSDSIKHTATEMQLMESTTRLLGSGMKLNAEQASLMGAAARELGKATGGDAVSGLETLSNALTTGRTRQLQMQIGLIDVAAGEEKFAASIGTTKDQLNATGLLEGKRLAILDATQAYLDRLGTSELSFAEKVKQGWTAVEEWSESLAKAVASSKDVNDALDAVGAALAMAFGSNSQSLMDNIMGGINAFSRAVTASVPTLITLGENIKTVWNFLADHMGIIVDTTKVVVAFGAAWMVWEIGGALVTGIVGGFTAITAGVTALTAAIALNPLGALAIGAVAAGTAISYYANSTADAALATEIAGAQQDVMNKAIAAGDTALKGLAPSAEHAADAAKYLAESHKAAGENIHTTNEHVQVNTGFVKDNESAVSALVATLTGEGKQLQIVQEAFTRLYDSGELYGETLLRMVPELDKLVKAHIALSSAQKTTYQDALNLQQSYTAQDLAILHTNGITLDYLATMKARGLSEQNIATLNGVSIESLKTYSSALQTLSDIHTKTVELARQHEREWKKETEERTAAMNAAVLDELDAQTKLNAKWGLDAAGAIKIQGSALDTLMIKLQLLTSTNTTNLTLQKQINLATQEATDKILSEAQAIDAANIAFQATIPKIQLVNGGVQHAISNFSDFNGKIKLNVSSLEEYNAALSTYYAHLVKIGNMGVIGMSAGQFTGKSGNLSDADEWASTTVNKLPTHATGGAVDMGRSVVVGETRPEVFTPSSSGMIAPNAVDNSVSTRGGDTYNIVGWDAARIRELAALLNEANVRGSGRKF